MKKNEVREMTTEERVIRYRRKYGSFKPERNTIQYKELYDSMLKDCYRIPVEKKMIQEEEASGFVLYVQPLFAEIIDSFDIESGKWETYLTLYLKNRCINYTKLTSRKEMMEKTVLKAVNSHTYQEEAFLEEVFDENELTIAEKRLLFIFHYSPVARENFYIFLLAYAAGFSEDMIDRICRKLSIDRLQTYRLMKRLEIDKERERMLLRREALFKRCNYNLNQALFAEIETDIGKQTHNNSMVAESTFVHDRNMSRQQDRLRQLSRLHPKTGEAKITELLKLSRGTVSSKIYVAKKLLQWVEKPDFTDCPPVIKKTARLMLENGTWEYVYNKMYPLKLFKPYEIFNIKTL